MLMRAEQQLHRVHCSTRIIIMRKRGRAASVRGIGLSVTCQNRNNAATGSSMRHLVQLHQRAAAAFRAGAGDSRSNVANLQKCENLSRKSTEGERGGGGGAHSRIDHTSVQRARLLGRIRRGPQLYRDWLLLILLNLLLRTQHVELVRV